MIINKISIPRTITLRRTDMFKPHMCDISIHVEISIREFQDIVDRNCVYDIIYDITKLYEST